MDTAILWLRDLARANDWISHLRKHALSALSALKKKWEHMSQSRRTWYPNIKTFRGAQHKTIGKSLPKMGFDQQIDAVSRPHTSLYQEAHIGR